MFYLNQMKILFRALYILFFLPGSLSDYDPDNGYCSYPGNGAGYGCAPGKYGEGPGGYEPCKDCYYGEYNPCSNSETCYDCPAGTETNNHDTGSTGCVTCDPGYYSAARSSHCKVCQAGKYNGQTAQAECESCPIGKYNPSAGSTDAAACLPCAPGTYNDQTAQASCTDCLAGKYNPSTGSTADSDCLLCATGKYNGQAAQASCTDCLAGKYNPSTGSTAESSCSLCATGTYNDQPAQASCLLCATGTYNDQAGQASCTDCAAGTYNNVTGQTSCTDCDTGKYNPSTGSTAESSCSLCATGKYNGQAGQASCTDCDAGTYNPSTGQASCMDCDTGKYNPSTAQTSCKDCDTGTYNGQTGQASCTDCLAGKYNPNEGSNAITNCLPCSNGTYNNLAGRASCTDCLAGKYNPNEGSDNTAACQDCQQGKYNSQTGQASCTDCDTGKFNVNTGSTAESDCQKCEAGKYNPYKNSVDNNACRNCEKGKYNDQEGQDVCKDCDTGKYAANLGSTVCSICNAGRYNDQIGQGNCVDCGRGRYNPDIGSTVESACLNCPTGKYNYLTGASSYTRCIICDTGQYNDVEGAPLCTDCVAGKYNPDTGSISVDKCLDCASGSSSQPGASICSCDDNVKTVAECKCGPSAADVSDTCAVNKYCAKQYGTCWNIPTGAMHSSGLPQCPSFDGISRNGDKCHCGAITSAKEECTDVQFCAGNTDTNEYWGCQNISMCLDVDGNQTNDRCHCGLLKTDYFDQQVYCSSNNYCDAEGVPSISFKKLKEGHCDNYNGGYPGTDLRKYDGKSDNPGTTEEERRDECAKACFTDKYNGRPDITGFYVYKTDSSNYFGRCYCAVNSVEGVDDCDWTTSNAYMSYSFRGSINIEGMGRPFESCSILAGEHYFQDDVIGPSCPIVTGLEPNVADCICPTTVIDIKSIKIASGNEMSYVESTEGTTQVFSGCAKQNTQTRIQGNANAALTSFSGLHCNEKTGCSKWPTCANEDATGINDKDCQCGANVCSAGKYCYSPQSFCYTQPNNRKVSYKNGVRPEFIYIGKTCGEGDITEDCVCGNEHVCPAGSECINNQCNIPDCASVDGNIENGQSCKCGESTCFSETGHYCQKNTTSTMDPNDFIELSSINDDNAENLQECTGECDSDGQCATGLKCFQRENGEDIPGCKGDGAVNTWDYCYDPSKNIYDPKVVRHDYCAPEPNYWPVRLTDGAFDYIVKCETSGFGRASEKCQCASENSCSYGQYCIDDSYCANDMKCEFKDAIQLHTLSPLCSCSKGELSCQTSQEACWPNGKCDNPKCAPGGSSKFLDGCKCIACKTELVDENGLCADGERLLGTVCSSSQYCYNKPGIVEPEGGCKNEPISRCFNREGDTPNSDYDICLCGTVEAERTFCTRGQYCNDEQNLCSDIPNPTCENTDGLFTNGDTTCLCMDEDGDYDICQPFHFCNVDADKKCHKQYCRDYVYGTKQLCNVFDSVTESREVNNEEQTFERVIKYGNGLVEEDKECTTTDVNGICQPESFKECCRECPLVNTHIKGTGLCQSDCDNAICTGEWVAPPEKGTRISYSTRFWNEYEIQTRLNPDWTNYCYGDSCDINDQKTCCVKPETCPIGKELLLCQELKHTRKYKANATCSGFECTADDCCEVRECTCTGGVPKPAYDCPQDGKEECDYCNPKYWKTANQTCSPIIECLATQFETLPPTPRIRNRACQDLTVCVGDEFISTNETIRTGDPTSDVYDLDVAVSDRTCQNRTRCLPTEYQKFSPNQYQDRTCVPVTPCGAEEYADRNWDGQQFTEDSVCKPRTICAQTEYIVSNGTELIDRDCSAIDQSCGTGTVETQEPIPGIRNRFCQTPRECTDSEYESQAPSTTQNRQCSPLTECLETEYQSQAPNVTTDRVCRALTECLSTEYQNVAPTPTTDRRCTNITICNPNNNEYEQIPPNATTDRQCAVCTDCVGCMQENDCTFDPGAKISYLDVSPIGAKSCSGHICTNYDVGGTNQHVVFHPTKGALEYGRYYRFNLKVQATLTIAGVELFKGRVPTGTEASIGKGEYIYFEIPMNHAEDTITYKPGQGSATIFPTKRDCQQKEEYVGSKDGTPVCTSVCGGDGSVLLKRTTMFSTLGDGSQCLPKWTSTPCICSPECPANYAANIDTYLTTPEQYAGACFNGDCKCPVDCVYTVNDDFEPCDAPCGEQGYKVKNIVVTTPAANNGKACPAFGDKQLCKGDYEIIRAATYENQNKCDCDGNTMDRCGICGGKNKCVGCDGIPVLPNGNAILPDGREVSGYRKQVRDRCGICGGDGSTCTAKFKLKAENKQAISKTLRIGLPIIIAVVIISIFITIFYCSFKKPEKKYKAVNTEDYEYEKTEQSDANIRF